MLFSISFERNREQFGIHKFLPAVKAVVTTEHITDGCRGSEKDEVMCSEEFYAEKNGSNRTVDSSGEKADQ